METLSIAEGTDNTRAFKISLQEISEEILAKYGAYYDLQ